MACDVERRVTIMRFRELTAKVKSEADNGPGRGRGEIRQDLFEDLAPILRDVLKLLDAP